MADIHCLRCRTWFTDRSDFFAHRFGKPSRCTLAIHPAVK